MHREFKRGNAVPVSVGCAVDSMEYGEAVKFSSTRRVDVVSSFRVVPRRKMASDEDLHELYELEDSLGETIKKLEQFERVSVRGVSKEWYNARKPEYLAAVEEWKQLIAVWHSEFVE